MPSPRRVAIAPDTAAEHAEPSARHQCDGLPSTPGRAGLWPGAAATPCPPCEGLEDSDPSQRFAEALDRSVHFLMSRFTLGLSPMARAEAFTSWLIHLGMSPGKQLQLWEKGRAQGGPPRWLRVAMRLRAGRSRAVHRTAAARQALSGGRVADVAVQLLFASLPPQPAVVAQRHDGPARRQQTA